MARVELPESRLRARKRRRRLRLGLLLGALVVLSIVTGIAASRAALVRVSTIEVSGNETLASSSVRELMQQGLKGEYLWVVPRDNIFVYPKAALTAELLALNPVFSQVEIHAVDFHTIAVVVVERQPRALWCSYENSCYFMDEAGVVYAQAPAFSAPVYTQYSGPTNPLRVESHSDNPLPKQFLTPADFAALSALVDALVLKVAAATSTGELSHVAVDTNNDVTMRFSKGFSLKFALHDQGGDVFERFALALTSDLFKAHTLGDFEYLDLRFGDKLYYKLR